MGEANWSVGQIAWRSGSGGPPPPELGNDYTMLSMLLLGGIGPDVPGFLTAPLVSRGTGDGNLWIFIRQETTSSAPDSFSPDRQTAWSLSDGEASTVTLPGPNGAPAVVVNLGTSTIYEMEAWHVVGRPTVFHNGSDTIGIGISGPIVRTIPTTRGTAPVLVVAVTDAAGPNASPPHMNIDVAESSTPHALQFDVGAAGAPLQGGFDGPYYESLAFRYEVPHSGVSNPDFTMSAIGQTDAFNAYWYEIGFAGSSGGGGVPTNDDFANAITLSGSSGSSARIVNTTATTEPSEPIPSDGPGDGPWVSLWWKWTCPAGVTSVTFDTFSSDAHETTDPSFNTDTVLAAYTGSTVGGLTEVAADDDHDGGPSSLMSQIMFTPTPGTTYHIQVSMYSEGEDAGIVLSWTTVGGGGGGGGSGPYPADYDDFPGVSFTELTGPYHTSTADEAIDAISVNDTGGDPSVQDSGGGYGGYTLTNSRFRSREGPRSDGAPISIDHCYIEVHAEALDHTDGVQAVGGSGCTITNTKILCGGGGATCMFFADVSTGAVVLDGDYFGAAPGYSTPGHLVRINSDGADTIAVRNCIFEEGVSDSGNVFDATIVEWTNNKWIDPATGILSDYPHP